MVLMSVGTLELATSDLERRDAEAEELCHEMTERLLLLHDEKAVLSANMKELSAKTPPARLIAADIALAAMATAGLVGFFAGAAAARFVVARKKNRTERNSVGQSDYVKLPIVPEGIGEDKPRSS